MLNMNHMCEGINNSFFNNLRAFSLVLESIFAWGLTNIKDNLNQSLPMQYIDTQCSISKYLLYHWGAL